MDIRLTASGGPFGQLLGPENGQPLKVTLDLGNGNGLLGDGRTDWPVLGNIPYLRTGRETLRFRAVGELQRGRPEEALAILLTDQDPFSPTPPPSLDSTREVVRRTAADGISFRQAMDMLNFGPVSHYFAHRWSAPTYLSGVGLLAAKWSGPEVVCEVACGVGQFLRDLQWAGVPSAGLDVVFAKLWLGQRFLGLLGNLICADIEATCLPLSGNTGEPAMVFCHDAFYFMADKVRTAEAFRRLAGASGAVLIGHAHNAAVDHRVAGSPLTPQEYGALFPDAELYDDSDLAAAYQCCEVPESRTAEELSNAEAVSLAWRASPEISWKPKWSLCEPREGNPLSLNPLLTDNGDRRLRPNWPMKRFAQEYQGATYLQGNTLPCVDTMTDASAGRVTDETIRLFKRRVLLDLPGGW